VGQSTGGNLLFGRHAKSALCQSLTAARASGAIIATGRQADWNLADRTKGDAMVAKKTPGKNSVAKLKLKKETLKDLKVKSRAGDVKGGQGSEAASFGRACRTE
jgi:hypothetical protein